MRRIIFITGAIVCMITFLFPKFWPKNELEISDWGYYHHPDITASGRNVYVCWIKNYRYSRKKSELYLQRSSDNGRSWLNTPIRIDRRDSSQGKIERPRIAASGSYVYVIWRDTRNGKSDIYLNSSSNEGISWLKNDIRIDLGDKPGASHAYVAEIAVSGSYVYAAWHDMRNGKADIYFNASSDHGLTWNAAPMRLDGDEPGSADSKNVQIAAVNKKVYVVWEDERNGKADIYVNRSTSSGQRWMSMPVRLDLGSPAGAADSHKPKIAAFQKTCFVVWEDYRNINADIYINYTRNNGASWQPSDIRLDTGDPSGKNDSINPQLALARKTVYVVWEDYRNEFNGGPFIHINMSRDKGNSWLTMDRPVEIRGTSAVNAYPQIEAVGKRCCIVWRYGIMESYNKPTQYIGLNFTRNKGKTWQKEEFWLNPGRRWYTEMGPPRLACSGDYIHVTWTKHDYYGCVYYNGGSITKVKGTAFESSSTPWFIP